MGDNKSPGKRESRHLAKKRIEKRQNVLSYPPPQMPNANIPTGEPSYEEALRAYHREQGRKSAQQGAQPKSYVEDMEDVEDLATGNYKDPTTKSFNSPIHFIMKIKGRVPGRSSHRDSSSSPKSHRAPKTTFTTLLLLSLLSATSAIYTLSPSLSRHPKYSIAATFTLLCLVLLFFSLKSAVRVSHKLGIPLLISAALLLISFIVGSASQVVINNNPVLAGSTLSRAIKIRDKLTTIGIGIEADRRSYLTSTSVEGGALLDTFPKKASSYQMISSSLIKSDPAGLPSLVWEPANKDLALAAYALATGILRRVEALNTSDPTAISDVAKYNQMVVDDLAAAYNSLQSASIKTGITTAPTQSPTPTNGLSNTVGGSK